MFLAEGAFGSVNASKLFSLMDICQVSVVSNEVGSNSEVIGSGIAWPESSGAGSVQISS